MSSSGSDAELTDRFYKMTREHYKHTKANAKTRVADSGSESDDGARQKTICLKNVPKTLNDNGLKNACGTFGYVKSIRRMDTPPYNVFIEFRKKEEAARAITGINGRNVFGNKKTVAALSRGKKRDYGTMNRIEEAFQRPRRTVPSSTNDEDEFRIDKRTLRWPFSLPTKFVENTLVEPITDNYYEKHPALLRADATKQFLFPKYKQSHVNGENDVRKIIDGRGIYKISGSEGAAAMTGDGNVSNGTYDAVKNEYSSFGKKNRLRTIPPCDNCGELADKYCQDCDAPYCSVQCIQEHLEHFEHCGENLQKICEIKKAAKTIEVKVPTQPEPIGVRCAVFVTCVIDHRTLFVRPTSAKENEDYLRVLSTAATESRSAKSLEQPPAVGEWVLAPWQKIYGRALVLKVSSSEDILCGFIDYGNVVSCRLAELREISADLKHGRWLNKKIMLKDVPYICISSKEVAILNELLLQNQKLYLLYDTNIDEDDDESDEFELINRKGININGRIKVVYDKAKKLTLRDMDGGFFKMKDLKYQEIVGADIPVIITENTALPMAEIGIIRKSDADTFLMNQQLIADYCRVTFKHFELERYTPREHEMCLVRNGHGLSVQYYRGYCLEVGCDEHPTIFFVDYGCMRPTKIRDIRPIPNSLMFPVLTRTVTIEGLLIPEELHMDMVYQKSKLLQAILPIGYAICLKNAECRDDESPATVQLPKALMDELTANWLEPIGNAIAEKAHQSPES